jgi:hypothetical protein
VPAILYSPFPGGREELKDFATPTLTLPPQGGGNFYGGAGFPAGAAQARRLCHQRLILFPSFPLLPENAQAISFVPAFLSDLYLGSSGNDGPDPEKLKD